MLNLHHLSHSVKQASVSLIPNPNHPLAQNEAYKQLKAAGWTCHNSELHPTDRVPVFRLDSAAIRRNKSGASHWLLEIAGETHPVTDVTVADITAAVQAELAEIAVKPRSAAQDAADSLTAELTAGLSEKDAAAIAKRIASGLELHTAGAVSQYNTRWDNAGALGCWSCDCPDAEHRALTSKYGRLCKHTAAGMIAQRLQQAQAVTTAREVEKRNERRARFATDPAPGDGGRLASDYETMKPTPRMRQELERAAARRERATALPAVAQVGSVLDWLDDDQPSPNPSQGEGRKTGADIIREIEAENAAKYAAEAARYAAALRADPVNLAARPNFERKGIGHL